MRERKAPIKTSKHSKLSIVNIQEKPATFFCFYQLGRYVSTHKIFAYFLCKSFIRVYLQFEDNTATETRQNCFRMLVMVDVLKSCLPIF